MPLLLRRSRPFRRQPAAALPRVPAVPRARRWWRARTAAWSSRRPAWAWLPTWLRSPRRGSRSRRPGSLRRRAPGKRLVRLQLAIRAHPLERAREAEQPVEEPGATGIGHEADAGESGDE